MSSLSLKEQLQALELVPATNKLEKSSKKATTEKSTKQQRPAWLEQAQYGVELLKAYFPKCFKDAKDIQPLKIGIKQDLVKFLSTQEEIVISDKSCMVNSLAYYVNSPSYHKSVMAGAERIDLEGNTAGIVTEEEAQYSATTRQAQQDKKKKAVKK